MGEIDPHWALPLLGGIAGIVLGFTARVNRFCTLSSLERYWYMGDATGLRTWVLAAATAIAATQILAALGLADIGSSFYLSPNLPWTGAILGGLMFGIGMALVGTCGFGAVVRLGGGSLRALIVLIVLGLSALAAQRGLIAQLRVLIVDDLALNLSAFGNQSLGSLLSVATGFDLTRIVPLIVVTALLIWIFRSAAYRANGLQILTGVIIGLVVSFGWWATTFMAREAFFPVQIEAGSFVVPVADSLLQLVTYTGKVPDYGVGLVAGTLIGAFLGARWKKDMRWEACDDARELSRHLLGAVLMGVGGVFAMGCTIGQGVSGASTLAVSVPLVMGSMAFGARIGLAWLLEGSPLSAFRRNAAEVS
ncbi:YeeE/YedE family protein [Roseibium litorale]|uniref:YeeE/YedE family protein n=1 Tax=Roseibium litorale TaxID=2803841 RepID=A0ABR9CH32_9HYPH|nr:YeeE/YedE family protein [Roseibium litorale]MBD8890019.1 YeeE/YedE family protein [Roseibium litorale]